MENEKIIKKIYQGVNLPPIQAIIRNNEVIVVDADHNTPVSIYCEQFQSLKDAVYHLTEFMRASNIERVTLRVEATFMVREKLRLGSYIDFKATRSTKLICLSLTPQPSPIELRRAKSSVLANELRSMLKKVRDV